MVLGRPDSPLVGRTLSRIENPICDTRSNLQRAQVLKQMQVLRDSSNGNKYSFKRLLPAVTFGSLLLLFWSVIIADALGKTDYHYWMDALIWGSGTLIPTLAPYIFTRKSEGYSVPRGRDPVSERYKRRVD